MGAALIGIGWILVMIGGMGWAREREKSAYNGGNCTGCDAPWRRFDTDSQGGRGYTCNDCGRGIWVSYRGID